MREDVGQDGQAVRERFSGTGLGDSDQIAFRMRCSERRLVRVRGLRRSVDLERAFLDLGRRRKAGFGEGAVEGVGELQVRPPGQLARG